MNSRHHFPHDLALLFLLPGFLLASCLLTSTLVPVVAWLLRPDAATWLRALSAATGLSVLGVVLLFVAKLPHYRAGIYFRVGCGGLPQRQQRFYRASLWIIGLSIVALMALLLAGRSFR